MGSRALAACAGAALLCTLGPRARPATPAGRPASPRVSPRDDHARPRALTFNRDDGLLYVARSTADDVAIVDPGVRGPRTIATVPACAFPDALAAMPGGGVLVACRFEPGLRRIRRGRDGRWTGETLDAGPEAGNRGLALGPGAVAYVASPPVGGIKVVSLQGGGAVVQVLRTGLSPRALRLVPAGTLPGQPSPLLLVSNFIDHTVTVHTVAGDGTLAAATQTIRVEAPVLDLLIASPAPGRPGGPAPPSLWLFTHEDRPLSRAAGPVEGLDSGVLRLPAGAAAPGAPFRDPGQGRRVFVNLGERARPVIELAAAARDPETGAVAVAGAGTDNLLVSPDGADGLGAGEAIAVGLNPTAIAALPGGRWATADRLSDTVTFVGPGSRGGLSVLATLSVGAPLRPTLADQGEVLFYSRALVPNNVAAGPLSLYTCAACHDDGHIDGRRHPAKRNRFFSMTKTCRGIGTTAPYLSLGEPDTIEAFADNIVATHAQGAERDPERFDKYPVVLRLPARAGWREMTLAPAEVRAALSAYMARIPPERSPYVAPGRSALTDEERRGLGLFRDRCTGCHQLVEDSARGGAVAAGALERALLDGRVALTSAGLHDVGTPVLGRDGNNPPSLRGVWDAAPYFSDGSARTLEEVLRRTDPDGQKVHAPANAGRESAFSAEEGAALLAFLRAL
jgi:mono/diheme cytochrome c family protein